MLYLRWVVLVCLSISSSVMAADREATVCGWFKERLMFKIWSSVAPAPDESRVAKNPLITSVDFKTSDKRTLRGYKYQSHNTKNSVTEPKGYILMALGNAMIADQMIGHLKSFSQRGYDVYIFDYRGYGLSEGKRRIKAFIKDYEEIINHLNGRYQKSLLYGVSLGGAVIANAIGSGLAFDRAVIDSSPSRFSPYGCPKAIDPAEHIPEDARKMLVITGAIDSVLSHKMTSEFRESARLKGAAVFDGPNYSHPFMDRNRDVHFDRLNRVINFLDGHDGN